MCEFRCGSNHHTVKCMEYLLACVLTKSRLISSGWIVQLFSNIHEYMLPESIVMDYYIRM